MWRRLAALHLREQGPGAGEQRAVDRRARDRQPPRKHRHTVLLASTSAALMPVMANLDYARTIVKTASRGFFWRPLDRQTVMTLGHIPWLGSTA